MDTVLLLILLEKKTAWLNMYEKQEEHHKTKTFREEYIELLKEHGIDFEEKYLF
jgi:putative transposase